MEMTVLMHEIRARMPQPAFSATASARSPRRHARGSLSPHRGAPVFQPVEAVELPATDQVTAASDLHFGVLSIAYAMMSRGELADLVEDLELGLAPPWLRPCEGGTQPARALLDLPPLDAPERLMAAAVHHWRSRTSGA